MLTDSGLFGTHHTVMKRVATSNDELVFMQIMLVNQLGLSRTMLKSVPGNAADFMVMRPEPTGQLAHQFLGHGALPTWPSSQAATYRL
jgi:hypothetical protein